MVQISRKKIPDQILSKLFLIFFQAVGNKNSEEEFKKIINDLFSETEKIMIIKRVAMFYLFLKEIDLRTIATVLRLSPSTVAKFSIIARKSEGLAPFFKKMVKREKLLQYIENIFYELFASPGTYGINWESAWKLKFRRDERKRTGL